MLLTGFALWLGQEILPAAISYCSGIPHHLYGGLGRYDSLVFFYILFQVLVADASLLVAALQGLIQCLRPDNLRSRGTQAAPKTAKRSMLLLLFLFVLLIAADLYTLYLIRTTADDVEVPTKLGMHRLFGWLGIGMVLVFDGIIITFRRWRRLAKMQKSDMDTVGRGDLNHAECNREN